MQASSAVLPLTRTKSTLLWSAWVSMLLVSDFPNMVWNLFGPEPAWLAWTKVGAAAVCLLFSLALPVLRPLWKFNLVLLALLLALQASSWLGEAEWWQALYGGTQATFASGYAGIQLRELAVAIVLMLLLALLLRRRSAFFLARGRLDAPLEPVRWLGIRSGETWKRFGPIFTVAMLAGGLVFVILSALPLLPKTGQLIPLLPFIFLFAAVNAIGEELTFRSPLLATLHPVVGRGQALWLTAIFFGSLHYLYGAPAGMPGFLLTAFVAYIYGKSMFETGGFFWAWFMHFISDIPIFTLIALSMLA